MPRELSSAEEASYARYMALGTPDEIQSQISKLRKEAGKYRTRATQLEEAAKDAPVVPEGGKVLTKEEAERFSAFEALKVKPADIQATIEERDKLKGDLATKDREAARDAAAKALGIEGKDLAPFAGADALAFSVKEEEVDGKKVQVAYVKDGDKEQKLVEFGKEKWGRPFEAVLGAASGGTPAPSGGTRYTTETGSAPARSGKATEKDYAEATEKTATYVI